MHRFCICKFTCLLKFVFHPTHKNLQHFSHFCAFYWWCEVKVAQLCLTLCDPVDYTVHGILQVRTLEWVAYPFSSGFSWPRNWTGVSCIAGGFFTSWATREALCWWWCCVRSPQLWCWRAVWCPKCMKPALCLMEKILTRALDSRNQRTKIDWNGWI